jgi:twitching motility protein PilT
MDELGLPKACEQLINRPRGLFLLAGPTGSGTSTSLASMVNHLYETMGHHIFTIEDPTGFYHYTKKSTVIQSENGVDVPSVSEARRQDPDVILFGELRDLATIEAAISAAETGHVVFARLHTNSAQGTVNRIIDVFPTNQQDRIRTQLSTAILGVLAQRLLPKIGGGRIACYEMLVATPAIGNLIRENKTFRITSAIETGSKHGMILMDDSLFHPRREGKCGKQEVLARSHNPDQLAGRIAKAEREIENEDGDGTGDRSGPKTGQ